MAEPSRPPARRGPEQPSASRCRSALKDLFPCLFETPPPRKGEGELTLRLVPDERPSAHTRARQRKGGRVGPEGQRSEAGQIDRHHRTDRSAGVAQGPPG